MPNQVPDPRLHLAAIIRSSDDAIISKTLEGVVTSWNAGAERVFGWTAEEAIGRSIRMIIPHDRWDEEDRVLSTISRGESLNHYETIRLTKDGRFVDISLTVSPIRDEQGNIVGASKIARDITEKKRYEEERVRLLHERAAAQEEANRLKDQFLATLSHELRTPLSAILGWTDLLLTHAFDADQVASALDVIRRNARTQARIIEDLLDVSRISQGQMKLVTSPVDFTDVVRDTLEVLRPTFEPKALHVRFQPGDGPFLVLGDADRLRQVLVNVISNSVKFTPVGGSIDVSAERAGDEVRVTVADTGEGIPASFLPRVFDRFRQADSTHSRHYGGLGLGLAIVREFVQMHGGSVRVESPGKGEGTTVTIELPALRAGAVASDSPSAASSARLDGLRVLVIDDEPDERGFLKTLLEKNGASARVAPSAKEGLEIFHAWRPNVVVCDIAMPDHDGHELIRALRDLPDRRLAFVPAIAVTAHARNEDRLRALQAGFEHYIAKPIDTGRFIGLVASVATRTRPAPV